MDDTRPGGGPQRALLHPLLVTLLLAALAGCAAPAATPAMPQPTTAPATAAPATLAPATLAPATPTRTMAPTAAPSATTAEVAVGLTLTILHTNDVSGTIEPCG